MKINLKLFLAVLLVLGNLSLPALANDEVLTPYAGNGPATSNGSDEMVEEEFPPVNELEPVDSTNLPPNHEGSAAL